jgi:DNA-binding protein H-NS
MEENMTQTVIDLLEEAKQLNEQIENSELQDAIEALEALGDDAKGSMQEYKDLKAIYDNLKNTGKGTESEAKLEKPKAERPKLKYKDIKFIGSTWRHKSDGYQKGFSTADECAEYFNKDK